MLIRRYMGYKTEIFILAFWGMVREVGVARGRVGVVRVARKLADSNPKII